MKPEIDIFLRTCNKAGIIDHHPTKRRCVTDTRDVMIKKSVGSLFHSLSQADLNYKLWIIDDGSSLEFLSWMQETGKNNNITLIKLPSVGHQRSADFTGRLACKNGRDLIYMIEDDYFHLPWAMEKLQEGFQHLALQTAWPIAIYPYDCVDRYWRDQPQACKMFYHSNLYWRTVNKSTNVIFLKHKTYVDYYQYFDQMYNNYHPDVFHEDHCINKIWNNMVDHAGPVTLFSPLPSLAIHLEHQQPTDLLSSSVDWRQQYESWSV